MINWDGIPVERNALAGAIFQLTERYRGVVDKLMSSPQMSMSYPSGICEYIILLSKWELKL